MRPDVCAHQSPAVIDGSPALLGQGGVFRQAIPGLSENASASCLARVCARLFHLVLRCLYGLVALLEARRRGGGTLRCICLDRLTETFPTPHLSVDEESSGSRPPIERKLTPVRA